MPLKIRKYSFMILKIAGGAPHIVKAIVSTLILDNLLLIIVLLAFLNKKNYKKVILCIIIAWLLSFLAYDLYYTSKSKLNIYKKYTIL